LREGLRSHGYVEGKTLVIDRTFLVDRYDGLPPAAARLASQKIDIIVTFGATAMQAARKATSTIPIVAVVGSDPVKLGVAASLSRPGGNVTGTVISAANLSGKRLELLKEVAPGMQRVAVMLYPDSPGEVEALRTYEVAARTLNLEVRRVDVRTPEEIGPAIAGIGRMNVQAIAVVGSTMLSANREKVTAAIAETRLPAVYANIDFVSSGGLLAYSANISDGFRNAGRYIDRILKGASPGDLPFEQSSRLELAVNIRTAQTLGITIPRDLRLRVDRVLE
jgi:putative ABC transport system substrate-binding protein